MPGFRDRGGRGARFAACGLALVAGLAAAFAAIAYVDRPPPGHTGGFGEPTCAVCHRGAPPDAPGGTLSLVAPATFSAGGEYVVEVRLVRPGMERAGFELGVRHAEGARAGRQAGELEPLTSAVQVIVAHDLAYAAQTAAGAAAVVDGVAHWRLRWRAPADAAGPVVFHGAANAGNFDDSELGDFVYLATALSRPASGAGMR